jgi:hypothetical protein
MSGSILYFLITSSITYRVVDFSLANGLDRSDTAPLPVGIEVGNGSLPAANHSAEGVGLTCPRRSGRTVRVK